MTAKGIVILAPMVVKQKDSAAEIEPPSKEPSRVAGFRAAYVFDVAQTEGQPLPQFAATKGKPRESSPKRNPHPMSVNQST